MQPIKSVYFTFAYACRWVFISPLSLSFGTMALAQFEPGEGPGGASSATVIPELL